MLFGAFVTKVQLETEAQGGIWHLRNWALFLQEAALPCALAGVSWAMYLLSRHSVRLELALGNKLFPIGKVPRDWGGLQNRLIALFTVLLFLAMYMAIVWAADRIAIASAFVLVIACVDWRTRFLIETGIGRYFSDPQYAPGPEDRDGELIAERRKVARTFLFANRHLVKETLRVAGCAVALGISIAASVYEEDLLTELAYCVLITTLIINEVVTVRWRVGMFFAMSDVEAKYRLHSAGHSRPT